MGVCFNNLWKLLIDKKMNKQALIHQAHISPNTVSKMAKDEMVSLEIISKVCLALNCKIEDVVEIVPDSKPYLEVKHEQ